MNESNSREKVLELAKQDPTVHAAYRHYRAGMAWREAMERCVIQLAQEKKRLHKHVEQMAKTAMQPPAIITVEPKEMEKLKQGRSAITVSNSKPPFRERVRLAWKELWK